jgi:hypothetical protein
MRMRAKVAWVGVWAPVSILQTVTKATPARAATSAMESPRPIRWRPSGDVRPRAWSPVLLARPTVGPIWRVLLGAFLFIVKV